MDDFSVDPSVKSETTDATGRSGKSEATIRMSNGTVTAVGAGQKYLTSPTTSGKKSLTKALRKSLSNLTTRKVSPKEIAACVQKLDREKDNDAEYTLEILKDELKPLLMSFANQHQAKGGKDSALDKNVGSVTVEILRHNSSNEAMVEECAGILYLLSIVNPNFKKAVARLFQAMQQHQTNTNILEDSALAIQNVVHANPDSHIRIASSLPVLWNVMARHISNSLLVGAALNVLEDLTFNPDMHSQRCLTEALPALLKVLETSAKVEQKIQACRILAELSLQTPANQQTIGFNLNYLLANLRRDTTSSGSKHDGDGKATLQTHALEVLANVAVHVPSHKHYVNRRAIPTLLRCLTAESSELPLEANVQACRAIANLTIPGEQVASLRRTAGPAVIESGGIPAILQAMNYHPNAHDLQIQACAALHHLCVTSTTTSVEEIIGEIIGGGGIPLVVTAIRQHSVHAMLLVQACHALYYLCHSPETIAQMTGSASEANAIVQGIGGGGIGPIIRGMAFHSSIIDVQHAGLKVLSRLSSQEDFEILLSEGGLDVLLGNLIRFCDAPEICLLTCEILKSFTRSVSGQSRDLQRAVASKDGIPAILQVMRKHVEDAPLQDAALASIRNLVLHPNNRPLIDEGGISTILVSMTVNSKNAAIQAYGCDALGRLAMDCSETMRYTIDVEHGMQVALQAMKDHELHPGVQDRVVFFLVHMTAPSTGENSNGDDNSSLALESLLQLKPLPLLKEARTRMPEKGRERLETLITRVQKAGGGGGGLISGLFGRNKAS